MPHITDYSLHHVFFVTLTFILATSVFYIHSLPPLIHNTHNNLANHVKNLASPVDVSGDARLSTRVANAELAYREVVKKRQSLVHKYGPSPSEIVPYVLDPFFHESFLINVLSRFPPDRAPWSPYTICERILDTPVRREWC